MTLNKITEGEIQSLTRRYLAKNEFRFFSRTVDGRPLHYRVKITGPPEFKVPDLVAVKRSIVLVFEEKTKYISLFERTGKDNMSDIEKLTVFLGNREAVSEFRNLVGLVGIPLGKPSIVGGLSSLKPLPTDTCRIPRRFVFIQIDRTSKGFAVEVRQDAGIKSLFNITRCNFVL